MKKRSLAIKAVDSTGLILKVEMLADRIWREHYPSIISESQIQYMLERFQSAAAIREQIQSGYNYFLVYLEDKAIGYYAFSLEPVAPEQVTLFLSKIYIEKQHRGIGAGRFAFLQIEKAAQRLGAVSISLTVNRHNTDSIKAYKRWGFSLAGEIVTDIGNGFVMDDYRLEKPIIGTTRNWND